MGARVYDPYTGTFTQPDPIQGGGANAYGYTDGDPVNETDIAGTAPCGECMVAASAHACSMRHSVSYCDRAEDDTTGFEVLGGVLATIATGGAVCEVFCEDAAAAAADEAPTIDDASAGHIFRDDAGHLREDTPENRALIEDTVKPQNYVRTGGGGEDIYRQDLEDGTQSWAKVYRGKITNGGLNKVPLR
jgi:uncharacterized protein RhaS with RHS repeats